MARTIEAAHDCHMQWQWQWQWQYESNHQGVTNNL